jgi:hypothetical protein
VDCPPEVMVDEVLRGALVRLRRGVRWGFERRRVQSSKHAGVRCAVNHPVASWQRFDEISVAKVSEDDLSAKAFQGWEIGLTARSHEIVDQGDFELWGEAP